VDIFQLAALSAAFCWAVATLFSATPAAHFGPLAFNRIRQIMMFSLLGGYAWFAGSFDSISNTQLPTIMLSGMVGIFIGDTALFASVIRLGPRRAQILFSMNAPMSTLCGFLFLDEVLSWHELVGTLIVIVGVVIAVAFGRQSGTTHSWENIKGALWIGVGFGLLGALGQTAGSLLLRPIMITGADPIAVSAVRIGVAALLLISLGFWPHKHTRSSNPATLKMLVLTGLSGFAAIGVGMTLVTFALSGAAIGIVSTLSSTAPVLLLPMLWIITGERPSWAAWCGAILVAAGTSLIFAA
jgi:drug/metabolite transporter (DMT)-like permease